MSRNSTDRCGEHLTIVYRYGCLGVEVALQGIQAVLASHSLPVAAFELYGKPTSLAEASPLLRKTRQRHFHLTGHGFEFDLATLGNFQLDFLEIREITKPRVAWDDWATHFIFRLDIGLGQNFAG